MAFTLGFAAGVMILVSFVELLAGAIEEIGFGKDLTTENTENTEDYLVLSIFSALLGDLWLRVVYFVNHWAKRWG
jgi:zinc transporter ZupT